MYVRARESHKPAVSMRSRAALATLVKVPCHLKSSKSDQFKQSNSVSLSVACLVIIYQMQAGSSVYAQYILGVVQLATQRKTLLFHEAA